MEQILIDYITNNFTKITNDPILKEVDIRLIDNIQNHYIYNIYVKTQNYKGYICTFDDKLEINIYNNRIIYKNLYRGFSNEPIINISSFPDLGNIISDYFQRTLSNNQ